MTETMTAASAVEGGALPIRRLFVTGASGYVGRNVIRHFVEKDVTVLGLARSARSAEIVHALGAQPARGDILVTSLAEHIAGCDALVHAAADTDHGLGGAGQTQVNEVGTRRVLEAARAAGVSRVVHLSTESVLADGGPLIDVDEHHPYPARPAGSYSRSKRAAERLALGFDGPAMGVVVLRPRMVWGRDDTTALAMLVEMARSGKLAWIDGGRYLTSTTHIANLCHGVELALIRGRGGEVYFIADEVPSEFRGFVTEMLNTQGVDVPDKGIPRWLLRLIAHAGEFAGRATGGRVAPPLTMQGFAASAVQTTLDIGKARRELGYDPAMTRAQGMKELRNLASGSFSLAV